MKLIGENDENDAVYRGKDFRGSSMAGIFNRGLIMGKMGRRFRTTVIAVEYGWVVVGRLVEGPILLLRCVCRDRNRQKAVIEEYFSSSIEARSDEKA